MKTKTVFTIRVCYKSGTIQEFDVTDFSIEKSSVASEASWIPATYTKPLYLGLDDVESIWQVGVKEVEDE